MGNPIDFRIFIPSYKRSDKTTTWHFFPDSLKDVTTFVVYEEEEKLYRKITNNLLVVPNSPRGIVEKRQHILENIDCEKIIMLDDDLRFAYKVPAVNKEQKSKYSLLVADKVQMLKCFLRVSRELDNYAHVSVLQREGANHNFDEDPVHNIRYMRFLAYRRSILLKHKINFNTLPLQEDFFVALSLMKLGYPSCIITTHTQGQMVGSNAPGGCSVYRTQGMHNHNCVNLVKHHSPFVTLRVKNLKKGWGGFSKKVLDVRVKWKQAFERGLKKYGERNLR